MASYTSPTSFGFMEKYAGMGGTERDELALERARLGVDSMRRSAAREDITDETAELNLEEARERRQRRDSSRDAFAAATRDLKADRSGTETAAGAAMRVSTARAAMIRYAKAGNLPAAFKTYRDSLAGPAERWTDEYERLGTSEPKDSLQRNLQIGSQQMLSREFDDDVLELPGGQTKTAKELFQDGETWKTALRPTLLAKHFTSPVQNMYSSEDDFDREIIRSIVDPAITLNKEGVPQASAFQRNRFGDFLAKNMKKYREVLGDDGVLHLVAYATDRRIGEGTAIDACQSVFDAVSEQVARERQNGRGGEELENMKSSLVGNAISLHEQVLRLGAGKDGTVAPEFSRGMSKAMRWAADAGVTDFSDPAVADSMRDFASYMTRLDRLDVPFLSEAWKAGASVRKAAAAYFASAKHGTPVPEGNLFKTASDCLDMTLGLLSGGMAPANVREVGNDPREGRGECLAVFGGTTGSGGMDSALVKMARTLQRDYIVPALGKGTATAPVDPLSVHREALADPGLYDRWARDISMATGLSAPAARFVAERFAKTAANRGGLSRGSLPDAFVATAKLVPESREEAVASAEVQRWLAGEGLGERLFRDRDAALTRHLMDPVVGLGLKTRDQVSSYLTDLHQKELEAVKSGVGFGAAYAAAESVGTYYDQAVTNIYGTMCRKAYLPDGKMVTIVPKSAVPALRRQPDFPSSLTPESGFVEEGSPDLKGAIPVMEPRRADLRSVSLPAVRFGSVELPAVPPGLWSSNPELFRTYMQHRRMLYLDALKGAGQAVAKSVKESAEPDEG